MTDLRAWREKHALTQQQLARLLGLPDSESGTRTVRRWELGQTTPPPYLWAALREVARRLRQRS